MSSPSSPSSSSGFSFFLKVLPSGDVMLIEASRRDRVSDIMARIKINKKIPGFEQCALVYGGRQLQSHQLLCDCSIEKNTLVFLIVGPNPWPAVDSLLDTVCRVYQGLGVDNDEISDKLNLFFHNIPWYDDKLAFEYLQLLSASSVPTALAMLYSSFKEEFAKDSIHKFLSQCKELPSTSHTYILPIILELCSLLKKVRPQKNLYLACWNVFASMSDCVSTCGEGMKSFITRAVVSFSMEVAILLQNTTILENMTHAEVFAELLTSLGKVLEDESQLTSRHFSVLESVIALSSGFYKFRKEELIGVLSTRRASLCSLVIRFAEKGTNHQWLNEYKELTNFEARRHLAMLMVPNANHFNKKIIRIHRDNLLAESFQQISDASSESLQHGISVEFIDEQGVGDGVTREWFELVSNEIFISKEVQVEEEVEEVEVVHPFHVPCSDFTRRFSPNPIFVEWEQFEFAGRLMGLALIHNMQLNVFLDSAFFLHLAGVVICLEDIKETEPELHKTLKSMLEGHGLEDLTFEIDIQTGKNVYSLEELCEDGSSTDVTMENVAKYVHLYLQHRFVKTISKQSSFFAKGFTDLLLGSSPHKSFFQVLSLEDLDLIFGGDQVGIRIEDWKNHTIYGEEGYGYQATDKQILWFWEVVEGMSKEQQMNLLKFWTSTSYLPHGGIGALSRKLQILKIEQEYPTSATCLYSLKLPPYDTFENMKFWLEFVAEEENCRGFGMQ